MKRNYSELTNFNSLNQFEYNTPKNSDKLKWNDILEFGPFRDIDNNQYFNIQIYIEIHKISKNNLEHISNEDKKKYHLPPFLNSQNLYQFNWFKIYVVDYSIDNIIKSHNINYGATSFVIKAIRKKDLVPVALKIFNKDINHKIYQNEIDIFEIFKLKGYHPNIVKMYEKGIIKEEVLNQFEIPFFVNNNFFLGSNYILLEWIEGQELFNYINNDNQSDNNINDLKKIINQLLEGIRWSNEECHIFNLDIKLENIMISKDQQGIIIKIIDWGFSTKEKIRYNISGSRNYCPPEVLNIPFKAFDSKISQMWSLGITIYALVFNLFPFDIAKVEKDHNFHKFYKLQQNNNCFDIRDYNKLILKSYEKKDSDILDLLNKMLICDPSKRLNNLKNIILKI